MVRLQDRFHVTLKKKEDERSKRDEVRILTPPENLAMRHLVCAALPPISNPIAGARNTGQIMISTGASRPCFFASEPQGYMDRNYLISSPILAPFLIPPFVAPSHSHVPSQSHTHNHSHPQSHSYTHTLAHSYSRRAAQPQTQKLKTKEKLLCTNVNVPEKFTQA